MEELVLRKRGFLYNIWKLTFGGIAFANSTPPKDTCSYRFQLIISSIVALLLLPLTIVRLVYNKIVESLGKEDEWIYDMGIAGYIVLMAMVGLAVDIHIGIYGEATITLGTYIIALVAEIALLATLILIVASLIRVQEYIADRKYSIGYNKKPKEDGTIVKLYKGWKNKYCQRIHWKN